jgi:glycosyltransferase involved in cell wall biosynthesis
MKAADVTVVTSLELKKLKSPTAKELYYLPNAADVKLFQRAWQKNFDKPVELKVIPPDKKVIFYMGNICHRLDYPLLVRIASDRNYWLVMVGPQTNNSFQQAGLDKMPNVIFTGKKSLEELPAYLSYSDCCIIPFLCNTLTKSIYPLKINEYLSTGKPVVTTNFSEDIANFGNIAFVSNSHDEFIANIASALATDSAARREQRILYSAANNWRARADELIEVIDTKRRR